jgi:homoserine/homoserine lactone efflux protein
MLFSRWLSFLLASLLISLSPGPGAFACMASGAGYGWRRGYWNAIGMQGGILVMLLVVGAGLGALLAVSPGAFNVGKLIGAAYLGYLGVKLWRAAPAAEAEATEPRRDKSRAQFLLEGFLINATNPKGAIFMLAVLPPFIDVHRPKVPQYATIAVTLVIVDLAVMAMYTALGAQLLRAMRQRNNQLILNRSFGTLFIAAALWVAVSGR